MQLGFLQNKSCLKLSLFCMRTDDWLNVHVKFQSVHLNINSTAHHFLSFFSFFFFSSFFSSSHKQNLSKTQTQKQKLVKLKTNAYIHVMCTNTLKKDIFYMLLTVSNLSDYWISCETCVTIQRTSEVEEVFQYYFGVCPQHQKLTRINTCSWSMVFVWSWRKSFSFHVTHVSVSQFCG